MKIRGIRGRCGIGALQTTGTLIHRYTAIVRPTMEYASPVWDPTQQGLKRKLEQVQHKAARFVHSAYTERSPGCVTKMVQELGWEPLEDRRTSARLSMLFKIHHNLVEISGASEALQLSNARTRGQHRSKQAIGATPVYRDSFFPCTISDWNRLPHRLTDCGQLEDFQAALRSLPT